MSAKINPANRAVQFQFCQKLRKILNSKYATLYDLTQMFNAKASTVRTWASIARAGSKTQAFPGMATVNGGMILLDEIINRNEAENHVGTTAAGTETLGLVVNGGLTYTVDKHGSVVGAHKSQPEATVAQLVDVLAERALHLDDQIETIRVALEELTKERGKIQLVIETIRSL